MLLSPNCIIEKTKANHFKVNFQGEDVAFLRKVLLDRIWYQGKPLDFVPIIRHFKISPDKFDYSIPRNNIIDRFEYPTEYVSFIIFSPYFRKKLFDTLRHQDANFQIKRIDQVLEITYRFKRSKQILNENSSRIWKIKVEEELADFFKKLVQIKVEDGFFYKIPSGRDLRINGVLVEYCSNPPHIKLTGSREHIVKIEKIMKNLNTSCKTLDINTRDPAVKQFLLQNGLLDELRKKYVIVLLLNDDNSRTYRIFSCSSDEHSIRSFIQQQENFIKSRKIDVIHQKHLLKKLKFFIKNDEDYCLIYDEQSTFIAAQSNETLDIIESYLLSLTFDDSSCSQSRRETAMETETYTSNPCKSSASENVKDNKLSYFERQIEISEETYINWSYELTQIENSNPIEILYKREPKFYTNLVIRGEAKCVDKTYNLINMLKCEQVNGISNICNDEEHICYLSKLYKNNNGKMEYRYKLHSLNDITYIICPPFIQNIRKHNDQICKVIVSHHFDKLYTQAIVINSYTKIAYFSKEVRRKFEETKSKQKVIDEFCQLQQQRIFYISNPSYLKKENFEDCLERSNKYQYKSIQFSLIQETHCSRESELTPEKVAETILDAIFSKIISFNSLEIIHINTRNEKQTNDILPLLLERVNTLTTNTDSKCLVKWSNYPSSIVNIEYGSLSDQQADIIAYGAGEQLESSILSKLLLEKAGYQLQTEFDSKKYQEKEIIETKGYNLNCKYVFHTRFKLYEYDRDLSNMADVLAKCFRRAGLLNAKTFSLPLVGSGILKYPEESVISLVKTIGNTVGRRHGLRRITIVVIDPGIYRALQNHVKTVSPIWENCYDNFILYDRINLYICVKKMTESTFEKTAYVYFYQNSQHKEFERIEQIHQISRKEILEKAKKSDTFLISDKCIFSKLGKEKKQEISTVLDFAHRHKIDSLSFPYSSIQHSSLERNDSIKDFVSNIEHYFKTKYISISIKRINIIANCGEQARQYTREMLLKCYQNIEVRLFGKELNILKDKFKELAEEIDKEVYY
ncbi:DgyrCDS3851 [Dimorphilus gyrociliatus]|uniref:DgyrCDS3851 n=1 Tax=Dimorphilus gyrociliatus TaxID=2664684 RepID=A0A7I8VJS0_9ANNE|nr:DgyrCDS3851 [Dimorphilus gyrociliatus]